MIKESVLLVDDDATLLELLGEHLETTGYQVLRANRGTEALQVAAETKPELVVLDVMMPGMDGWEVCRRLRETSSVPIILLTAKDQEIDKLRGFRLGIDDYVTKPFSFAELTARVGAILGRARVAGMPQQEIRSGDLLIDLERRRVTVRGSAVDLTPTEYRLLTFLARHANRPVPTEQLLREVWGPEYHAEVDYVKRFVWALRKKIEADPGAPQHILTERGFGYRFQ